MKKTKKNPKQPDTTNEQEKSEFEKTGISRMSFKLEFSIKRSDMLRELVKKTEGSMLKSKDFNENNN